MPMMVYEFEKLELDTGLFVDGEAVISWTLWKDPEPLISYSVKDAMIVAPKGNKVWLVNHPDLLKKAEQQLWETHNTQILASIERDRLERDLTNDDVLTSGNEAYCYG